MSLLQTELVRKALASSWVVAVLKRLVPPLDRFLLLLSRGWLNAALQSVALIETVGARSGLSRRVSTLCMPMDQNLVLVGSNWGQSAAPGWVHNLRASPSAKVWFRGFVGIMNAREVQGQERAKIWQQLIEFNPQYQRYQDNCTRLLPVIVLSRPIDRDNDRNETAPLR